MTFLAYALSGADIPGGRTTGEHAAAPPRGHSHPGGRSDLVTDELTHLLFDRCLRDQVHRPWRRLAGHTEFGYRPGLTPRERMSLSYDRLRLVNSAADGVADLVTDPRRLAALHEWIGPLDGGLTTLASIHYNLFLGSLLDHDGDGRDLSDFTSLRRTGTFLCTELDHGNDVASMQTVAVYDRASDEFVLHTPTPGARKFMPNTGLTGGPKSATVAARLLMDGQDQGIFLFLVPLSDENGHLPGVRVQSLPDRTGTPVDHSLTAFEHVRLPRTALLQGDHGRLAADGTLSSTLGNRRKRFLRSIGRVTTGKLCMSAGTLGMSRAALAIAVRYSHSRLIAGARPGERVPLAAHRSHHGRLLHGIALGYAMTFLHRRVVDRWVGHTAEDREEVERLVAVAKGWITWQAREIVVECRERCGAQGLFPVNGIADLAQNIEGGITAEGDNLVIWVKAAGEMVFGHEAARAGRLGPLCPDRDLADPAALRDLLAEAEGIWQCRARTALREGPKGDPLARWNETSSAALEMVSAHARLQAADAFMAAADAAVDPAAGFLLRTLCRLFLLGQLAEYTGDLLAEGLMTADQVRALPKNRDAVLADLAPHMMTLVDGFGFPAEMLAGIPIADGRAVGGGHEGTADAP